MAEERILRKCSLGPNPDPAKLQTQLRAALVSHPLVQEAFLFGSLADGTFGRNSDVDLILVAATDRPFLERFRDFGSLFEICSDLDLLIYTPVEIERLRSSPSAGFWKSVWRQAVRLAP